VKTGNKEQIQYLKERDLYSIILYAIYKCTGDEKYSTISELIYTIDKDSLLNLCSVFGGTTIRIPTVAEMKLYTNALLVYKLMLDGKSFQEAFSQTGLDISYRRKIATIYNELVDIIENYEQDNRGDKD